MRSHRKLVGTVAIGALLSGTAVFWLVGIRHEPMPKAKAELDPNGCGEGQFCGKLLSTNGGCTAKDCCESGEFYCYTSYSRTPSPFNKVRSVQQGEFGQCFAQGDAKVYCTQYDCSGETFCSQGSCGIVLPGNPLTRPEIVPVGGVCPTIEQ